MTTDQVLTQAEIRSLILANAEKVFSTMLELPIHLISDDEPFDPAGLDSGVVALIGFVGRWIGSGAVACTTSLACRLSGKMLLTTFEEVNDEVLDTVGEIGNMIIGNFKDDVAQQLGPLGLTTPTVIYGENLQAHNWNGNKWIAMRFECDGDLFEVRISVVPSEELRRGQDLQ